MLTVFTSRSTTIFKIIKFRTSIKYSIKMFQLAASLLPHDVTDVLLARHAGNETRAPSSQHFKFRKPVDFWRNLHCLVHI